MNMDLYGQSFYACFTNGDEQDETYPFAFHNEYQLVPTYVIDPFLKNNQSLYAAPDDLRYFAGQNIFDSVFSSFTQSGLTGEPFIHDKLKFLGKQQIYRITVKINKKREARKLGEYKTWYKITFSKQGLYSCSVQDYSASPEDMLKKTAYRCDIECLSKDENDFLLELYKIYPNGTHIFCENGKKKKSPHMVGSLVVGTAVNKIVVWHCAPPYYLCVEFDDAAGFPIGLFDMGFHAFVFDNYSDQHLPPMANWVNGQAWGGREPITVIISHCHDDHIDGLYSMVVAHNQVGANHNTYNYFFANIDLYMPNTLQSPAYTAIVNTINTVGNVTIYNDNAPFSAPTAAFDYGLAQFNHPTSQAYDPHPHLHGMYLRCTTVNNTRVMMVGDTVYRGIAALAGLPAMPGTGDLAGPYDVLIGCHHGGDYAVGIAAGNNPPGVTKQQYIPVADVTQTPTVIYSANGSGGPFSTHPHPARMTEHAAQSWAGRIITNAAFTQNGAISPQVAITPNGVDIT